MIIPWCEHGWKKRCEIFVVLASHSLFLRVSSIVKFWTLIPDGSCVRYVLDPPCWCSVSTTFTESEMQWQRNWFLANPAHQAKALELAHPWISFAEFYVCFIGRRSYMLVFAIVCNLLVTVGKFSHYSGLRSLCTEWHCFCHSAPFQPFFPQTGKSGSLKFCHNAILRQKRSRFGLKCLLHPCQSDIWWLTTTRRNFSQYVLVWIYCDCAIMEVWLPFHDM